MILNQRSLSCKHLFMTPYLTSNCGLLSTSYWRNRLLWFFRHPLPEFLLLHVRPVNSAET